LNQSAQFNAQMKQQKEQQRLASLKDIYQDIGRVQETAVMDQDKPAINSELAGILSTIAEDPQAALGGAKYAQIQQSLGKVRAMATTSKQDNIYSDETRKFLAQNPDMDTPENRQRLAKHDTQPIGGRSKFMLDTPVKFDPEAAMGKILQQKQVAIPWGKSTFSPDNKYIIRESGVTYGRKQALDLWNQGYETGTDANNQPIKKWAKEQFETVSKNPDQLARFGNPKSPQELYENVGKMMYGSNQDIVGEKNAPVIIPNQYALLGQRENFALYKEGVMEGNREKLAAVKKNLELQSAPENANFLVRQYSNLLGNTTGRKEPVYTGNGKIEAEDVVDIPENQLKKYAQNKKETLKEGGSLDPVTETISEGGSVDLATRTKDGNLRLTVYKKYTEDDKKKHLIPSDKKIGDIFINPNDGRKVVDKENVIPRRDLLTSLGKGVVETKKLAYAIDEADRSLKGASNETIDKINKGEDDETATNVANKAPEHIRSYRFKGKTFTHSQIEKAAKQSGVSVEEYIKKVGLQ
jgi:hypothetical protein